jgi:phosphoribosylformimino-5-aminoimidazole carboxamide ribotide isomerase
MQVVGVLDLLDGLAVHARGGDRAQYAAVTEVAGWAILSGDPLDVARVYVERLGISELYVADLNAILGRPRQEAAIKAITALGVPVWLDAGIGTVSDGQHVGGLGVRRVIVGLETLPSFDLLDRICAAMGGDRVAFSLDLRGGAPVVKANGRIRSDQSAERIATRAAEAGAGMIIVLDLARVGSRIGLDLELLARLRSVLPGVLLAAGGGVRGSNDLARLADAGCDAALVATALHTGQVTRADVEALRT